MSTPNLWNCLYLLNNEKNFEKYRIKNGCGTRRREWVILNLGIGIHVCFHCLQQNIFSERQGYRREFFGLVLKKLGESRLFKFFAEIHNFERNVGTHLFPLDSSNPKIWHRNAKTKIIYFFVICFLFFFEAREQFQQKKNYKLIPFFTKFPTVFQRIFWNLFEWFFLFWFAYNNNSNIKLLKWSYLNKYIPILKFT